MAVSTLTSRERLLRTLNGQPVDRVPIRLWGVDPLKRAPRPAWQPLHDLVNEYQLDCFFDWWAQSAWPVEVLREERNTADLEWFEVHTTLKAPAGDLTVIHRSHRGGKPGYVKKHLIETTEDARRWLSLPPRELPAVDSYADRVAEVGERGLVMIGLAEAMYAVNDATGSELWGYWLYDERALVEEMVTKAAKEIFTLAKHYVEHGIGYLFGWVGPELCIPPLASPHDFDELVTRFDKPVVDLIHNAGGKVWVHCHGDMHPVLERFADMGIDILNPIEPPPMGRLTLADAKRRVGDRMTLEGNVEVGAFELDTPDEVAAKTAEAVAMGKPGGRFILCPSSDHSHWPELDTHILDNYRVFVETGLCEGLY